MSSLFDGTWQIDFEDPRSKVWDPETQSYIADEIGAEIITLKTEGDVQHYQVVAGTDPKLTMGYDNRYDDPEWAPYTIRAIEGNNDPNDFRGGLGPREGGYAVGDIYYLTRTVLLDDRTHYRLMRELNGDPGYVMLRRLAEDGQSYVSAMMDVEGIVRLVRVFRRVK